MVEAERIELSFLDCKTRVFPLNYVPINFVAGPRGFEPLLTGLEPVVFAIYTMNPQNLAAEVGIEPTTKKLTASCSATELHGIITWCSDGESNPARKVESLVSLPIDDRSKFFDKMSALVNKC